jgi:hypothetical protein
VVGQLTEKFRVTSALQQGNLLGPLLVLEYANDIFRNMEPTIRAFGDDCVMYRKIKIMQTWENCRRTYTGWESGRLKLRRKCIQVNVRQFV